VFGWTRPNIVDFIFSLRKVVLFMMPHSLPCHPERT
jgi:hypothetical protein